MAKAQERLGKWLSRLFAASPKGKESTIDNALIEFTLTRLVKQLINGGVDTRLQNAAGLIREGRSVEAAKLQSGVIAALLEAEFRLLVGAEREALAKAMDLFVSQQGRQETLRLEIAALDAETFRQRRAELVGAQAALHRNLQLLLMPAVPARRTRLFDDVFPPAPAVADLLAAADDAMAKAASHIEAGERDAAGKEQQKAQAAFASLADIGKKRIVDMTQAVRIERQIYSAGQTDGAARRVGRASAQSLGKDRGRGGRSHRVRLSGYPWGVAGRRRRGTSGANSPTGSGTPWRRQNTRLRFRRGSRRPCSPCGRPCRC